MVEELSAYFDFEEPITTEGLTVEKYRVRYRSDHEAHVVEGEEFEVEFSTKSYLKAVFNLRAIPKSAEVVLTHLQALHISKAKTHGPVNISVNGTIIRKNLRATVNDYSTDVVPIAVDHLKVGSNFVTVSPGRNMLTQYWIKTLQVKLKSKNDGDIIGQVDFRQESITHTGAVNSVIPNDQCAYGFHNIVCNINEAWSMETNGKICISFSVASLTGVVLPCIKVTLRWLRLNFYLFSDLPARVELCINGEIFKSHIVTDEGSSRTFDVPVSYLKVGENHLKIGTPYRSDTPLLLQEVCIH